MAMQIIIVYQVSNMAINIMYFPHYNGHVVKKYITLMWSNIPFLAWPFKLSIIYLVFDCLKLYRHSFRRESFDTSLCDKVCQWLAAGRWFSLGTPVSSTNKTDCHDITELLLKVALNIITITLDSLSYKDNI